jgi:hypothetical protein
LARSSSASVVAGPALTTAPPSILLPAGGAIEHETNVNDVGQERGPDATALTLTSSLSPLIVAFFRDVGSLSEPGSHLDDHDGQCDGERSRDQRNYDDDDVGHGHDAN